MRLDMSEYMEKHAVARAIQRRLENKLAEAILSQKLLPGKTGLFDFGEDGWKLEPRRTREAAEAAAAR